MSTPSDDDKPQWESSWQQPREDAPSWQPQQPQQDQSQWQSSWQPQPVQPQWQGYQPSPSTPGSAVASLVLGICGIILCPIITSIIGLVLGYSAKNEIDQAGGRLGGRDVAKAGIITSWVGLVIWGGLFAIWTLAILAFSV